MDQWLGWDDTDYDITTRYWRHLFPTMESFTKYMTDFVKGKTWNERWDITEKILDNCKWAMGPYHDLSKDEQKMPEYLAQIQFIRTQCRHLQTVRSELATEWRKVYWPTIRAYGDMVDKDLIERLRSSNPVSGIPHPDNPYAVIARRLKS